MAMCNDNGSTVLLPTAICVTASIALQSGGRAAGAVREPGPERETGETAA